MDSGKQIEAFKTALTYAPNGVSSYLGIDQIDWGNNAVYEVWKVSPCCGTPFSIPDAIYCWIQHWFCGLCTSAQVCAWGMNQELAFINHLLLLYFCYCCMCIQRHNIRKRAGIPGNLIGDFMCQWCFPVCSKCQELRAMPKEGWDFIGAIQNKKFTIYIPDVKVMA